MNAEPEITIYGQQWVRALNRVDALPGEVRGVFARMLVTMAEGWAFARPMQAAVEAGASRDGYTLPEVAYYSAEVLVVDLFRTLALEVVNAIPDMEKGHAPDVMLDDLESEAELLMRYLVLTEAALQHPDMPETVRAELLAPMIGLREWLPNYWTTLGELETALVSLGLPESPTYETRVQRFKR